MAKINRADFETFLRENNLDEFDNEEIARRLSNGQKFQVDGITLRNLRKGLALNPRTSWKVWVLTGKKLRSLKPKNLTSLMEWCFERELTVRQLAEKAGRAEGTLAGPFYHGSTTRGALREKLFEITGLRDFAPLSKTERPRRSNSQKPRVTQREMPRVLEDHVLESRELTDRDLATAKILEGVAELIRSGRQTSFVPEEKTTEENFEKVFSSLSQLLEKLKNNEELRKQIRNQIDLQEIAYLASGLKSLIKESDFQAWMSNFHFEMPNGR